MTTDRVDDPDLPLAKLAYRRRSFFLANWAAGTSFPENCWTSTAVTLGIGIGVMWRYGTMRTDTVKRLEIPNLGPAVEEVVFAFKEERNPLVDLFFNAVETADDLRHAHARNEEQGAEVPHLADQGFRRHHRAITSHDDAGGTAHISFTCRTPG